MLVHFKLDSFLIDSSLIDYLVIKKEETPNADVAEKRKKKSEILLDGKSSYDKKITVSASLCSVLIRVVHTGR